MYPNLRDHVRRHTLQAVISSDLDPAGVRRVLQWTTRLSFIQWRYNFSRFTVGQPWLLSEALDIRQLQDSGTELHIENLPLREHAAVDFDDALSRVIPAGLLTSLKLGKPAPPLTTKLAPLKNLLLQAKRLHTLHYEDRGQGTSFKFQGDERMPAVQDLMLRSYDWDHSRRDVARHWDFSRIRSLQLVHVPSFNFLSSINPVDLRNLHTLRVEDASAHLPDKRREATRALSELVSSYIDSLETLDLVCHLPLFSLDALLSHRNTLQVLRLRDHVGFGEEDRACPTVDGVHLARLAKELKWLHTLELDLDVTQCESRGFLSAACRFGNLHTLTVHVQTLLRPLDAVEEGTDRDFEAAMQSFRFLIHERDRLAMLHNQYYKPWKRITINVGGWRRVMVRRVSAAWRERNERGIFAERCFVLERSPHGQLGVREEIGVESPSRRATPEL
ncbi:F-box domain-containing protein [Sarocladium implicatum]|nr:F-box domain-containing protein [Sarocladium implicatum]